MQKGFWGKLSSRPIVGLSPMDGVTDAPMRFIVKKYGNPDIIYTEFVSAEGLWRIKKRGEMDNKIWQDLRFDKTQGPTIAQIFGSDPESFYEASKIICELGFDGIDINMGCPSPGLEKRGGGAGLIRDKCNAVEVVEATRGGVKDFFDSKFAESSTHAYLSRDARMDMFRAVSAGTSASSEIKDMSVPSEKISIPVSLKTRLGSEKPDPKWWEVLAGMQMSAIAMHGRTFKQLYSGEADWELLLKAAEVIQESGALFLGNGDVANFLVRTAPKPYSDLPQAGSRLRAVLASAPAPAEFAVELKDGKVFDLTGKMDGVLVGREAIGNPWVFRSRSQMSDTSSQISISERLKVAVEHSKKFEEILPEQKFFIMRKHLVKYASGFPDIVDLRKKIVMTNSAIEVENVVNEWLESGV